MHTFVLKRLTKDLQTTLSAMFLKFYEVKKIKPTFSGKLYIKSTVQQPSD